MKHSLPDFNLLWDYSNPAKTEKKFLEILHIAENSDDKDYHAQLLTQIARTYSLRRKFEEAHAFLDKASVLISEETPIAAVCLLLERGRTYNSAGKKALSIPLFRGALDRALATDLDNYAVDAAHMLGIASPIEEILEWNLRAVEISENSHDARAKQWLGTLYNNIGWTYFDQKLYDKAINFFRRNQDWCKEYGLMREERIAIWSIAKALRMQGFIHKSLAMQIDILASIEASGEQDGFIFEEIGECLLSLNRNEEAAHYFNFAHNLLLQDIWLKENEPERLKRMKNLAYQKQE